MEFIDRKGTNLNRKKLKIISQTPTEIIADIERFDNVTEEGTQINAEVFNKFQEEIKNANTKSGSAETIASSANTTAENANTTAASAKALAETAETNSANAVTTANTAKTNSESAVATANSALNNSNNAVTTANSALNNSNNAVATASTAKTNSEQAVTTANSALSNSTQAINIANTAKSTASSALTKSEQAIANSQAAIDKATSVENALADRGATVYVNGEAVSTISFNSDPQEQISSNSNEIDSLNTNIYKKLNANFSEFTSKSTLDNSDLLVVQNSNNSNNKITWNSIKSQISNSICPIGTVTAFAGATIPSGWLLCDGGAISRTTYSALFNAISTTYGAGNGSSTFNLPNLSGKVAIGVSSNHNLADSGGEENHYHTFYTGMSWYGGAGAGDRNALGYDAQNGTWTYGEGDTTVNSWTNTGLDSGSNLKNNNRLRYKGTTESSTNMQPYLALNYIIKY